jgi:hypothetical protein
VAYAIGIPEPISLFVETSDAGLNRVRIPARLPPRRPMQNPAYIQAYLRSPVPLSELPPSFGIVTACNPFGRLLTEEANQNRTHRLREHLTSLGLDSFPVTGGDEAGVHLEPGFGIPGTDRDAITRIGAKFEQDAVFWVSAGILELVPCGPGAAKTLGRLDTRWLNP